MNIENYDFESVLEQGFKSLFAASDIELTIADDVDLAISDEAITMQIDAGGPGSDEHLNDAGEYDIYTGSIEIEVRTLRASIDTVTNSAFKSRQSELVAGTRQLLEEIDANALSTYWGGAISPTKIKPNGTQRDIDHEFRYTRLSYEMQFRIT
jgi:hypothetical protein